jgi:signal transduction histidine kinase
VIRSIYVKVILGFSAILILAVVALIGTTVLVVSRSMGPKEFVEKMLMYQADSMADAFDRGGPSELRQSLDRLTRSLPGQHFLVDTEGRDVLNGHDHNDLMAQAIDHPTPFTRGEIVLYRETHDKRYRLVHIIEAPMLAPPFAYYLWIPVGVVAACAVLAYLLLRPVRRLRRAVRQFGHGELSARSGVTQRDEIGQLAAEFDRMAEQIEHLVLAERRLLQDVSHELRSPLARLAFALELAKSGPDRDGALERAKREYRRMTDLVAELIELTHAEGEPLVEPMAAVDLPELLREIVADGEVEAEAKNCKLVLRAESSLFITGYARLMHRALENVLRNAIKYTPTGSEVHVTLNTHDEIQLCIRDFGPGVPEESLEAIFTPFFRVDVDRSRDGGGVGLGLAIARRIIAVHHGEITARNVHPGLEVTVRLPSTAATIDGAQTKMSDDFR